MKAGVRFLGWISASLLLLLLTAPDFPALLRQSLGSNFGTVFPAIPFAALLGLIFALRWRGLAELLVSEESFGTLLPVRLAGAGLIGALVAAEPLTSTSVGAAGIAVVLTFLGASLVINPRSRRMILQYAAIYSAGLGAPFVLSWVFGQPLAVMSSGLSSRLVGLLGFPVSWQGTQFELFSKSGEVISGVVTPGCSSIISVTTFLGLLALMHLDLRKDTRSTLTLAIAGIGVLILLNTVRISLLMWVGYQDGSAAFWGVHDWIGYALFVGFYLAILPVYSGMKGRTPAPGFALAS